MTPFMQKMMAVVAVVALVVSLAGLVLPSQPTAQPAPYGSAWNDPAITKITALNWVDMANNVTRRAFLVEDLIANLTKSTDANSVNISKALDAADKNASLAIDAGALNVTALSGNGTAVYTNSTAYRDAYYNLTAAFSEIAAVGTTQALNVTVPSAGYYLISADIREIITVTSTATQSSYILCTGSGTSAVTNSERAGTTFHAAGNRTLHFDWIYAATGSTKVKVCGKVDALGDGIWAVVSDPDGRSVMSWVRLP